MAVNAEQEERLSLPHPHQRLPTCSLLLHESEFLSLGFLPQSLPGFNSPPPIAEQYHTRQQWEVEEEGHPKEKV